MRRGLILVAVGGALGGVLALAGARVMRGALFVGTFDPLSFGLAFLALAVVAALSNLVPALRASRVDPMLALRVG